MKKNRYALDFLRPSRPLLLLWLVLLSSVCQAIPALARPVRVLVDYCFTTADYAMLAETVGPNVNFTFHPIGATAGGNLALIYIREGRRAGIRAIRW